jgi:hypothetical protein
MNEALIAALTTAADACANASTEVTTCVQSDNPRAPEAEDLLDECTDDIRALIVRLQKGIQ